MHYEAYTQNLHDYFQVLKLSTNVLVITCREPVRLKVKGQKYKVKVTRSIRCTRQMQQSSWLSAARTSELEYVTPT